MFDEVLQIIRRGFKIHTSLTTNDVEHIFMCLLTIYRSSFMTSVLIICHPFKNGLVFLVSSSKNKLIHALYMFIHSSSLSGMCTVNIYFFTLWLAF